MVTSISNHTIPIQAIEVYYLDCWEENFGLPDGEYLVMWQAYCPLTNRPLGPRGGDPNPAYIRLWMDERHGGALECQIETVAR